jgi:hypothetical protein
LISTSSAIGRLGTILSGSASRNLPGAKGCNPPFALRQPARKTTLAPAASRVWRRTVQCPLFVQAFSENFSTTEQNRFCECNTESAGDGKRHAVFPEFCREKPRTSAEYEAFNALGSVPGQGARYEVSSWAPFRLPLPVRDSWSDMTRQTRHLVRHFFPLICLERAIVV